MKTFINTTFRGLLFIIPIVALIYLFQKFYTEVKDVVIMIIEKTPLKTEFDVLNVVLATIFIVVLISFIVGLLTKTKTFSKITRWVDLHLIDVSQLYRTFKLRFDNSMQFILEDKPPIFVSFGNFERPGFLIEEREHEGKSIVFIPKNIRIHDGQIFIVDRGDVRLAKGTKEDFTYDFERLGRGMNIS